MNIRNKEILSKAFNRKQTTQNFSSKYQKILKNKKKKREKKDNLTVFESKHL